MTTALLADNITAELQLCDKRDIENQYMLTVFTDVLDRNFNITGLKNGQIEDLLLDYMKNYDITFNKKKVIVSMVKHED